MQFFMGKKKKKKKPPTSIVSFFIMGYLKNILLGVDLERFPSVMHAFLDSQSSPVWVWHTFLSLAKTVCKIPADLPSARMEVPKCHFISV